MYKFGGIGAQQLQREHLKLNIYETILWIYLKLGDKYKFSKLIGYFTCIHIEIG